MSAQQTEIIASYDVMFALRTGVTIMIPANKTFECGVDVPVRFRVSPDNPCDVLITVAERSVVLKELRKDYLAEAIERGVIMFYEMEDDEVVRCTPCHYHAG